MQSYGSCALHTRYMLLTFVLSLIKIWQAVFNLQSEHKISMKN